MMNAKLVIPSFFLSSRAPREGSIVREVFNLIIEIFIE